MNDGQLNNVKVLKPIRQALRNDATAAEKQLWQFLKGSQLSGRKFRRQHSVGYFILDFYCPSEQLAIELDGMFMIRLKLKPMIQNDRERLKV